MANDKVQEIAEYLGVGGVGLLFLKLIFHITSKLKINCDCNNQLFEIKKIQNATILDIQNNKKALAKFFEEFSEVVLRLDNLESNSSDLRSEIQEVMRVGGDITSGQKKQYQRLKELESEDKELNKSISKLSEITTYLGATIEPMKDDIKSLKISTDKTNEILMQMNNNISLLMGKLGGI